MLHEDRHLVIGRLLFSHIVLLGGSYDHAGSTPRCLLDDDMSVVRGNSTEVEGFARAIPWATKPDIGFGGTECVIRTELRAVSFWEPNFGHAGCAD